MECEQNIIRLYISVKLKKRMWAALRTITLTVSGANFQCLQENHVNLVHIESRKSKRRNSEFEIFVDCDSNHEQLNEIIQLLQKNVNVLDMEPLDNSCLHKEGELNPSAWSSKTWTD